MRAERVHAVVVVTDGVVRRASDEPREKRHQRLRVATFLFLVAQDAFAGHEVRIGTRVAGRAILIVRVHHEAELAALADALRHPTGPLLRANIDEAELDARNAPVLVNRQHLVNLLFEREVIHIEQHADTLALRVAAYVFHVERALAALRIQMHAARIGLRVVLEAIPAGVELDVLQAALHGEIHARLAARGRQRHLTDDLAGLDPRRVGERARVVQVQDQIVVFQQAAGGLRDHDHAPRSRQRRRAGDLAVLRAVLGVEEGLERGRRVLGQAQFHARIIHQLGLGQGHEEIVSHLHHQRPLAAGLDLAERRLLIDALRVIGSPSSVVGGEMELRRLPRDAERVEARLLRQGVAERDAFVRGAESQDQLTLRRGRLLQLDAQLVVVIADRAALAIDRLPGLVVRRGLLAGNGEAGVQRRAGEFQSEPRSDEHRPALVVHAVARHARRAVERRDLERQRQLTIRRLQLHRRRVQTRGQRRAQKNFPELFHVPLLLMFPPRMGWSHRGESLRLGRLAAGLIHLPGKPAGVCLEHGDSSGLPEANAIRATSGALE